MSETKWSRLEVVRAQTGYPHIVPMGGKYSAVAESVDVEYAYLFAAAPELYYALEAIQFKGHNQVCPVCKSSKKTGHGAMCDVGRALAKARGEA